MVEVGEDNTSHIRTANEPCQIQPPNDTRILDDDATRVKEKILVYGERSI